jgi:hypothetical protein
MRHSVPVLALVAVLLVGVLPASAASSPHLLWKQRWNGGGNDEGAVVRTSPSGDRVYVTGRSDGKPFPQTDLVTIAYTSAGKRLWVNRYTADWSAEPQDMVVSTDGTRIYVAANAYPTSTQGNDYLTIAYTSTGTRLWVKHYDDPHHGDDQAYGIAVRPDGSAVYLTGLSFGTRTTSCGQGSEYDASDIVTVAYSKSGVRTWVARYDNESHSNDDGVDVAVDASTGDVIVAGVTVPYPCYDEVALLAYRPDGSRDWVHVDDSGATFGEYPIGLGVDGAAGTIFVAGGRFVTRNENAFLIGAYSDATGDPVWRRPYSGPGQSTSPFAFVLGRNDRLYVAGLTGGALGGSARWDLAAFDGASGGNLLWNATYVHGAGQNWAYRLAESGGGTQVYGYGIVGSGLNRVVAFSATDGGVAWSAPTSEAEVGVSPLASAPYGHRVYFGGSVSVQRGPFDFDDDVDVRAFG